MTIGELFLLIVLFIVIILGIAYALYEREVQELKNLGYKNPYGVSNYGYWVFISFLTTFIIVFAGFIFYEVITNWNIPI